MQYDPLHLQRAGSQVYLKKASEGFTLAETWPSFCFFFFSPLWSLDALRFVANLAVGELSSEEVWVQQMAPEEPEVSPQTSGRCCGFHAGPECTARPDS